MPLREPLTPAARVLELQRTAGNAATCGRLRPGPTGEPVQRLEQSSAFLGAVASYLNPLNQAARLTMPGLDERQKSLIDGIFGASLSSSIIRINYNSAVGAAGDTPRTTGNIINVPGPTVDDDTLVHECAHVWQHQNGVLFGYAVSALRSQAIAAIVTGSRNGAYDYSALEANKVPWRYWNAEQQASWIEHNRRLPDDWWLAALDPPTIPGMLGLGGPDVPFN